MCVDRAQPSAAARGRRMEGAWRRLPTARVISSIIFEYNFEYNRESVAHCAIYSVEGWRHLGTGKYPANRKTLQV